MSDTTHVFLATVLPNGFDSGVGGLKLSLCLELNRNYAPVTQSSEFQTWLTSVDKFFALRKELVDALESQTKKIVKIGGKSYAGQVTTKEPEPGPREVWSSIVLPPSKQFTRPGRRTALVPGSASRPLVGRTYAETEVAASASLVAVARAVSLHSPMGGMRTLTADERAGLEAAVERKRGWNRGRIKEAAAASGEKPLAGGVSALGVLADRAESNRRVIEAAFIENSDYTCRAFDSLNASPQLRRIFGTTIDLTVVGGLEGVNPAAIPVTVSIPASMSALLAADVTLMRLIVVGTGGEAVPRLIVSEGVWSQLAPETILRLDDASVLSFEPQSAAAACEGLSSALISEADTPFAGWPSDDDLAPLAHAGTLNGLARQPAVQRAREALRRQAARVSGLSSINNRVANTVTKGHAVYQSHWPAVPPDPGEDVVTAAGATRAYCVYVRTVSDKGASGWMSLTTVEESVFWKSKGAKGDAVEAEMEMGVHVGGAADMATQHPTTGEPQRTPLSDGFVFGFDGTGLSWQNPLRHDDRGDASTARAAVAQRLRHLLGHSEINDLEIVALEAITRGKFAIDWFPFEDDSARPTLLVRRGPPFLDRPDPVRLCFGNDVRFQYIAVATYHNGYVPLDVELLNGSNFDGRGATPPAPFLRHDHIREVPIALEQDIYVQQKTGARTLRREYPGESDTDLVVRTGDILSNDTCTRYLLPPAVPSFQTYLWYSHSDLGALKPSRIMGDDALFEWYRRYSCDARTAQEFRENQKRRRETSDLLQLPNASSGCRRNCTQFCGGISQPRVFDGGNLGYLPDPIATGVYVRFFSDKNCVEPAEGYPSQFCRFNHGNYPNLRPWRLTLAKRQPQRQEPVSVDQSAQRLTVFVAPGAQLYAQVIPTFAGQQAHFAPSLIPDTVLPKAMVIATDVESGDVADPLHAGVKVLTLTHATQRPLIAPTIRSMEIKRFRQASDKAGDRQVVASTFEAHVRLHHEHLNARYGTVVPDEPATGAIELFALWNDFNDHSDGPSRSIEQKRQPHSPSGGFVRIGVLTRDAVPESVGVVDAASSAVAAANYWSDLTITSAPTPYSNTGFTDVVFKVRNISIFYSYFHNGSTPSGADVEDHSRWSKEYTLGADGLRVISQGGTDVLATFMPNNRKPSRPMIRKIVGLIGRDDTPELRSGRFFGARVRIYLELDGRNASGQGERMGLLVREPSSIYGKLLKPFVSATGQDIVTDGPPFVPAGAPPATTGLPPESELSVHDLVIGDDVLEPDYLKKFRPEYDRARFGLPGAVGVVSYVPHFDPTENLWYIDPEFRIRNAFGAELHNPFVQLGLVTYQPYSANYNAKYEGDQSSFDRDFRLSAPELTQFFSVYPTRDFASPLLLFQKSRGRHFTLSGATSSLYFKRQSTSRALRSQFVLEVERRDDGGFWETIESTLLLREVSIDGDPVDEIHAPETFTRHLLLPKAFGSTESEERLARSRFECRVAIDFKTRFLETRTCGRYRVVVREIEWFPTESSTEWDDIEKMLRLVRAAQIPGIRVRQPMIFAPQPD